MALNIKLIAIIGTGPAGIASLYEFLHTNADGTSTVGGARSADPAFTKVVAFEQKDKAGGIWAPSFDEADYPLPPQDLLDTNQYNNPDVIHPAEPVPENLERATASQPFVKHASDATSKELQWSRSGVYSDLFTNIPNRFTRFSYNKLDEKLLDTSRLIYPFMTNTELTNSIRHMIETENLNEHIRTSTRVENVQKKGGKWEITARKTSNDGLTEEWYTEEFDAVVVSNGHYTVPSIPCFPGLAEFNAQRPGVLSHSKSFRSAEEYRDKKILFVGGSISTINLVQYAYPLAKSVYLSRRGKQRLFPWINRAADSEGIVSKTTIERFIPETNEILFTDGTKESGFDLVVFATGYHFHYPFLKEYLKINDPSNRSSVSGLYYNTFAIDDPTLGAVGVTISTLKFHTIETSAAALAGVWSNAKQLPAREEQEKWVQDQKEAKGGSIDFHYYTHEQVRAGFVDPVHKFAAVGRASPLEVDGEHLNDFEVGFKTLERLFYGLKNGEITPKDTLLRA